PTPRSKSPMELDEQAVAIAVEELVPTRQVQYDWSSTVFGQTHQLVDEPLSSIVREVVRDPPEREQVTRASQDADETDGAALLGPEMGEGLGLPLHPDPVRVRHLRPLHRPRLGSAHRASPLDIIACVGAT